MLALIVPGVGMAGGGVPAPEVNERSVRADAGIVLSLTRGPTGTAGALS